MIKGQNINPFLLQGPLQQGVMPQLIPQYQSNQTERAIKDGEAKIAELTEEVQRLKNCRQLIMGAAMDIAIYRPTILEDLSNDQEKKVIGEALVSLTELRGSVRKNPVLQRSESIKNMINSFITLKATQRLGGSNPIVLQEFCGTFANKVIRSEKYDVEEKIIIANMLIMIRDVFSRMSDKTIPALLAFTAAQEQDSGKLERWQEIKDQITGTLASTFETCEIFANKMMSCMTRSKQLVVSGVHLGFKYGFNPATICTLTSFVDSIIVSSAVQGALATGASVGGAAAAGAAAPVIFGSTIFWLMIALSTANIAGKFYMDYVRVTPGLHGVPIIPSASSSEPLARRSSSSRELPMITKGQTYSFNNLKDNMDAYQLENALLNGVEITLTDDQKKELEQVKKQKDNATRTIRSMITRLIAQIKISQPIEKQKLKSDLQDLLSQAARLGIFYKRAVDGSDVDIQDVVYTDQEIGLDMSKGIESYEREAATLARDAVSAVADAKGKAKELEELRAQVERLTKKLQKLRQGGPSSSTEIGKTKNELLSKTQQVQQAQQNATAAEEKAHIAEKAAEKAAIQYVLFQAINQQSEGMDKFIQNRAAAAVDDVDMPAAGPAVQSQFSRKSKRKSAHKRKSPRKSVKKQVRKSIIRKAARKSVKKSSRKAARKSARKSVKKSVRKSARKPVRKSKRKSVKKSARKSLKKSTRKPARKSLRKSVRKSQRKSVKKSNRKPARKSLRKSARRGGKGMKKSR